MSRIWRNILTVAIVAVLAFAVVSVYTDVGRIGDRLRDIRPAAIVAALALAALNYLIRFFRWEYYLRRTQVPVPRPISGLVFVSGFTMSVTPGKLGELLKAALLHDIVRAPVARTAPIVVAERVTDLVALVLVGLAGVAAYGIAVPMVLAGAAAVGLGLVVVASERLAHACIALCCRPRALRKFEPRLREMYDHLAGLVAPRPLAWGTALGVVAWLCECIGFALIARSIPGAIVPVGLAMLIYAATTVAGALSFLPGGLVVTEASMVLLLVHSARGLDQPAAVAATIVTRLCTLWFAVLLGALALLLLRRLYRPDAIVSAPTPGDGALPVPVRISDTDRG